MDIQLIDNQINDILNGNRDLPQFNQPEHAGVCSAGPLLVGALIVCDIARQSLIASVNASGSKEPPANWQIDEEQERQLQQWTEAKDIWIPNAEEMLTITMTPQALTIFQTACTLRICILPIYL